MTNPRGQPGAPQAQQEPLWPAIAGPALVLIVLLGITIGAASYQHREERREAIESSQIARTLLGRRIERMFDDTLRPLRRLQIEWSNKGLPTPPAFTEAVVAVATLMPQHRMVSLVGADNRVIASWARDPGDVLTTGMDLTSDPMWADAMRQHEPEPAVGSMPAGLLHADRLPLVVPLLHKEETEPVASIVGQICLSELLRDVLDPRLAGQFNLTLRDEADLARFTEGAAPANWAQADDDEPVRVLDAHWDLRVLPAVSWSRGTTFGKPQWTLMGGGIVSMLASGTMLQAALYRRRERHRTRQHLDALESLNQISAALTSTPGAGLEVLSPLAADVKRLLRMPMVCIFLLDSNERTIRLVYYAGVEPPVRSVFSFDELPGARQCFEQGKVMIVPDLHSDPGPFNLDQVKGYGIRAIVLLPMIVNGTPLGIIGLSDTVPRQFSDVEVRMARLWGAEAGVILAQAGLYQELRQQVQTNETLLRELNHRVKNNLTGILGMLEMGRPPLGPDARRWLERVAARVETMARTHELFTGGIHAVGLEDLINKTLAPIRAMKPPGVSVEVEMTRLQAPIPVERAVTLAIVLNELCYNSIVHGISAGGTLTVRGRTTEAGLAAIDVVDCPRNGNGQAESSHPVVAANSTGIGLTLVRALVGRELRGSLSLSPVPSGGTVATVEFPLEERSVAGDPP